MTNKEYADSLRQLADFYEKQPSVPQGGLDMNRTTYECNELNVYGAVHSKEEARNIIRALGSCQKEYQDSGYLIISKRFGAITLRFYCNRETVCERVVLDKIKTIEKRAKVSTVPPSPVEYEEVAVEREIVEWRCPDTGLLEVDA